ncbi:YdeI/OmpD-associated family protein [Streptococcus iniae]
MTEPLFKKLKMAKFQDITLMKLAREKSVFDHFPQNAFPADLIVGYVYHLEEMKELIFRVFNEKLLKPNGHLYLMYPKTKNKLGYEAIGRDSIFPFLKVDQDNGYVEGTTIKFNRMNALDDNYTLLGLKYTKEVEEDQHLNLAKKLQIMWRKLMMSKLILQPIPKKRYFLSS